MTRLAYGRDVELVLMPHLGHYRLSDLDGPLLRAVFAEIAQTTNAKGLPQSPILREHRRRQLGRRDRRQATHMAWIHTGYVFTREDGQPSSRDEKQTTPGNRPDQDRRNRRSPDRRHSYRHGR
jgi:hypothetical protein